MKKIKNRIAYARHSSPVRILPFNFHSWEAV